MLSSHVATVDASCEIRLMYTHILYRLPAGLLPHPRGAHVWAQPSAHKHRFVNLSIRASQVKETILHQLKAAPLRPLRLGLLAARSKALAALGALQLRMKQDTMREDVVRLSHLTEHVVRGGAIASQRQQRPWLGRPE